MKACPFCAEEIQDAAIICRHCQRDVSPSLAATVAATPTKNRPAGIRLEGRGKWVRSSSGEWQLLEFYVQSFTPQDDEPLAQTILRLQAVEGRWKDRPDPLGELERIRHGDDEVQ